MIAHVQYNGKTKCTPFGLDFHPFIHMRLPPYSLPLALNPINPVQMSVAARLTPKKALGSGFSQVDSNKRSDGVDWVSGSDLAALRDGGGTTASPSPWGRKRFNDGDGHSAIPRSHRDLLNVSDEEDKPEVSLSDSYVSAMHDMVSTFTAPSVQRGVVLASTSHALTAVPKLIRSLFAFAFSPDTKVSGGISVGFSALSSAVQGVGALALRITGAGPDDDGTGGGGEAEKGGEVEGESRSDGDSDGDNDGEDGEKNREGGAREVGGLEWHDGERSYGRPRLRRSAGGSSADERDEDEGEGEDEDDTSGNKQNLRRGSHVEEEFVHMATTSKEKKLIN